MNHAQVLDIIRHGENSGVEFKPDDISPERLAQRITALLNLEGGHVLLGVEDDGSVSGLTRELSEADEWVMQKTRDRIYPPLNAYWETLELEPDKVSGVISLPANAPDKPYKAKRGSVWVTQVRVVINNPPGDP